MQIGVLRLFVTNLRLNVLGKLLRLRIADTRCFRLVHQNLLIRLPRLGKHRLTPVQHHHRVRNNSNKLVDDLRSIEEALCITVMDHLRRAVPASMIGITSIRASVRSLLLHFGQLLIFQASLDVKELLGDLIFLRVTHDADARVPGRPLSAQEVTIDLMLHRCNRVLDLRVLRVSVIFPPGEAGLVASVVLLAVMNRADLDLSFEIVLLRQRSRGQHGNRVLRGAHARLLQVSLFLLDIEKMSVRTVMKLRRGLTLSD